MKVALICDVLGAENNGTTVAAMNLARHLRAKGHKVNIVCADQDKIGWDGYFITPVRSFGPLNNYVRSVGVQLAKADDRVIRQAIKDVDIVHCFLPFTLTKHAISLAHELNIPVTSGFHCQAENFSSYIKMKNFMLFNRFVYKYYYRTVFKKVDAVHYPSQFICDYFEKITKPTNHYVISNGVNNCFVPRKCDKPDELKDKFVILSTGRYSNEKCQDVLLKAVAKSKYKDNIHVVLAGCGTLANKYKRLVSKLDLDVTMNLYDRNVLLDVIAYSDLYVHPSDVEIEGIACTEAMKCGKTPIVSDSFRSATKGFARDERNLFKAGNPADLAKKIDYWIEHPEELAECSQYYAENSESTDQKICMEKMEQMLLEVIGEKLSACEGSTFDKGAKDGEANTILSR